MVNALETQLLPVCGLASHEEGIQLLRACLATARNDPTYGRTETKSESPVWGCNDDWALLRPELEKRIAPLSPKLPTEVMALPAAFFRDPTFAVPDPEQDCVIVFGGVANVKGAGAGGCHFMPLLTQRQAHSWHSSTSAHEKWRDMVLAVEGRGDGLLLVDRVREAGDCYFHSLLITLHAKGILFRAAASNESTPPPRQGRLSTSPPSSQEPGANRRGLCFHDAEDLEAFSFRERILEPYDIAKGLDTGALFLHSLMHRTPTAAWFTSADVRQALKNLRAPVFSRNLVRKIDMGVAHLIDHCLLEACEANLEQDDFKDFKLTARAAKCAAEARCTGKPGKLLRKRSATEIRHDPRAMAERKRLRLSMHDFSG